MIRHNPPHATDDTPRKRTLKELALEEVRSFLILFVYLWILFGLFVLNQAVIEREHGGTIVIQGFALLNALVLAKVMLVIEKLELARWLRGLPGAIVILYEALICTLFFLAFHFIERGVMNMLTGHATATEPGLGGGGLLGVVIVSIILFVSMLPFFAFKNVARAIGPDRMWQILFHRPGTPR